MASRTFVEKILAAPEGAFVFRKPDIVLTHDNTISIMGTFKQMGGEKVFDPDQLFVALDHNAPPTNVNLANNYRLIREFVKTEGIKKFYEAGKGICHQLMANHARPGMVVVGSDSHTCTAGAMNTLAAGIDRTEAAGLYLRGETWFRVPRSMKITLQGRLRPGVYAKDLSLWIIGRIGTAGANYMSIEYHGEGVKTLSVSERMTLANLASEMGAKNAVFPADDVLLQFLGKKETQAGIWADPDAVYAHEMEIDLDELFPVVAAPHTVENVKAVSEVEGARIQEAIIGTCTNGRLEDLRIAADVLDGKRVADDVRLLVIPASQEILLRASEEGLVTKLISAGATLLAPSCGPCLGTGQGIPADGHTVISTANRNFLGRMGNPRASIFLASPATVATSAINGYITDPRAKKHTDVFKSTIETGTTVSIPSGENRKHGQVWNYKDVNNLTTDQMFSGKLTYNILSSDPPAIISHLFKGFDQSFAEMVRPQDIIIAGDNFGCGSAREHPSVGLAHIGVRAVIVKSVNRIFYRASINQGLPLIVHPEAVETYQPNDVVDVNFKTGELRIDKRVFQFEPLPQTLMEIIEKKGLVNWLKKAAL